MGTTLEADFSDTAFPLTCVINTPGTGGVTGVPTTVAVRQSPMTNLYLDWATSTFKTSGWTTKNLSMTDLGTGAYQAILNVSALGFSPTTPLPVKLVAEYTSTGTGTSGFDVDIVVVSELRPDAKLARQYHTNKATTISGQLKLFNDDGVTVLSTQAVLDYTGAPAGNTAGTPAQRSAAPP